MEKAARGWTRMPVVGPRYWSALCLASIAGADLGDVVSRPLHLGYWHGLPPLAGLFAATMLAARLLPGLDAWYWIGILLVRTAATNLADLQTLVIGLPMPLTAAMFLALLALLVGLGRRDVDATGLPVAGGSFWAAMLAAGTLGTALGDDLSFGQDLGPPVASACTTAVLAAALAWRALSRLPALATFWALVIVIRTWGTNFGDATSDACGLVPAAIVSLGLFAGLLILWRPAAPRAAAAPA